MDFCDDRVAFLWKCSDGFLQSGSPLSALQCLFAVAHLPSGLTPRVHVENSIRLAFVYTKKFRDHIHAKLVLEAASKQCDQDLPLTSSSSSCDLRCSLWFEQWKCYRNLEMASLMNTCSTQGKGFVLSCSFDTIKRKWGPLFHRLEALSHWKSGDTDAALGCLEQGISMAFGSLMNMKTEMMMMMMKGTTVDLEREQMQKYTQTMFSMLMIDHGKIWLQTRDSSLMEAETWQKHGKRFLEESSGEHRRWCLLLHSMDHLKFGRFSECSEEWNASLLDALKDAQISGNVIQCSLLSLTIGNIFRQSLNNRESLERAVDVLQTSTRDMRLHISALEDMGNDETLQMRGLLFATLHALACTFMSTSRIVDAGNAIVQVKELLESSTDLMSMFRFDMHMLLGSISLFVFSLLDATEHFDVVLLGTASTDSHRHRHIATAAALHCGTGLVGCDVKPSEARILRAEELCENIHPEWLTNSILRAHWHFLSGMCHFHRERYDLSMYQLRECLVLVHSSIRDFCVCSEVFSFNARTFFLRGHRSEAIQLAQAARDISHSVQDACSLSRASSFLLHFLGSDVPDHEVAPLISTIHTSLEFLRQQVIGARRSLSSTNVGVSSIPPS
jgi:hypothetical protein